MSAPEMYCPVPAHRHDNMLGCRKNCEHCLAIYESEVGHPYDPTDPVNGHAPDINESFYYWEPGDRLSEGVRAHSGPVALVEWMLAGGTNQNP